MVTCPYCNKELRSPPKRAKVCPSCKNRVYALGQGRYGTEAQHAELQAAEAMQRREKQHREYRTQVLKELLKSRSSGMVLGIKILAGADSCEFCKRMNGKTVTLDSAIINEKVRPPFDQCTSDVCRCTYTEVLVPLGEVLDRDSDTVGAGRRGPRSIPIGRRSGCLVALAIMSVLIAVMLFSLC